MSEWTTTAQRGTIYDECEAAEQALTDALPEGAALLLRLDKAYAAREVCEEELLILAIAAHLPGLAPAIRLIGKHITDCGLLHPALSCCEDSPTD
jgi:hypothetical protein